MPLPKLENAKFSLVTITLQIIFIILFAIFCEYAPDADARIYGNATGELKRIESSATDGNFSTMYSMFQDVHVMIFIGFGFLMTFLKRYGFSSVGLNMMVAAIVIQWAMLVNGFYKMNKNMKIEIDLTTLLTSDFSCAAVLISFGALLGKISPLQAVVLAMVEIPIFSLNEHIGLDYIKVADMGGSMFVHVFGAYYGIAAARVLWNKSVENNKQEGSRYTSDIFAMIGTVFLWLYWPSFNAGLAVGDDQKRAVINTYLSLSACTLVTFSLSSLVSEGKNKFDMVHIQNATLAGGVAIGTVADFMVQPWGALVIGVVSAVVSVCGYRYLTPFLSSKKFHDTCGVNNLHGMPGILAALFGIIYSASANFQTYGFSLYQLFPNMAPNTGMQTEYTVKDGTFTADGLDRSSAKQAGCQAAALLITIILAIAGGLVTGFFLKLPYLDNTTEKDLYSDKRFWETPDDFPDHEWEEELDDKKQEELEHLKDETLA